MPIPFSSSGPENRVPAWELTWSKSERTAARKAFEHALGQELQEIMQQAKEMAAKIESSDEVWKLERYLTRRRERIDRKYDYRYSRLTFMFGTLVHEGRLTEQELRDLHEDKLQAIRSFANFLDRQTNEGDLA